MQYSLYNPPSTITHTIGNTLTNRYNTIEVEVKNKKLYSYMCISIHMHRYSLVITFSSLCLDFRFWASLEMLGEYMTFKCAEDMLKHNFLTFMLCSLTSLLFLSIVSNGCISSKVRFVCLPALIM